MATRAGEEAPVHLGDPLRLRTKIGIALVIAVLVALTVAALSWNNSRWRQTQITEVRADRESVRLALSVATCNAEHRTSVRESRTEVRVLAEHRHNTPDDCADGVAVALQQPVGDRTILDDRTGERLPVQAPVQEVVEGS